MYGLMCDQCSQEKCSHNVIVEKVVLIKQHKLIRGSVIYKIAMEP